MSIELGVALAVVCRVAQAPRSTVYARRDRDEDGSGAKRGPKTTLTDEELTEKIREVIRASPFSGEGHRKVTARLRRDQGIHVGRKRVLRWLGIEDSPEFVGEPPCNGCAERFIRTLKEQCTWTKAWEDVAELRAAVKAFIRRYNDEWLIELLGHRSPRETYEAWLATREVAA